MRIEIDVSEIDIDLMCSASPQAWVRDDRKGLVKKYVETLIENHIQELLE